MTHRAELKIKYDAYRKERFSDKDFKFNEWRRTAGNQGKFWDADLTNEFLKSLPLVCHYSGIKLTLTPNQNDSVSLDRIDSSKGYCKNNVVFCSKEINYMKKAMTSEHFIKLCTMIGEHNG